MVIQLLALFWLGMSHVMLAQESDSVMVLTLDQALEIAKVQSPTLLVAEERYADTYWQYRAFLSSFYPQLSVSGTVPSYNQSLTSVLQPDGSYMVREQQNVSNSLSLGITQQIPLTGGRLSVSSDLQRTDQTLPSDTAYWSATPVSVTYSQPFFAVNSMAWNRQMEPLQYQLAEKEQLETLEQININITQTYFNAYIAQINKEIAQVNVTVNDTIFKVAEKRYEVGKIAENELLESEYNLISAEYSLDRSNLNLERTLRDLKISLGLPLDLQLVLEPPQDYPEIEIDPEFALEQARENASFPLSVQLQLLQAERTVYETRANQRFSATMNASVGTNKSSAILSEVFESPSNQGRFSISFDIPLFQAGQGKEQIQAALARQRQTEINSQVSEIQFEQDIDYQVKQFEQAFRQLQMAAKADTIAARRFEVATNRYLIGKVEVTDFFRAQNDKDNARVSYLQAVRDYWVAYYTLRQLTLYDFENGEKLEFTRPGDI